MKPSLGNSCLTVRGDEVITSPRLWRQFLGISPFHILSESKPDSYEIE